MEFERQNLLQFKPYSEHPSIRRLEVMFDTFGSCDYIGEAVSILEHSVQSAYFASRDTDDKDIILACFFHDIGHILGLEANLNSHMGDCGIMDHEHLGADFLLSLGFKPRIAYLVRSHVQAKRYLCFKDPNYHSELSEASKVTLTFQGGVMTAEEADAFERDQEFKIILLLRKVDETAKVAEMDASLLKSFKDLIPDMLESIVNPPVPSPSNSPLGLNTFIHYSLSPAQKLAYQQTSYLKVDNVLAYSGVSIEEITSWIEEISMWPKVEQKYIQHYELNPVTQQKQLCRSENFLDFHPKFMFFTKQILGNMVNQLFGKESVLLKEKINYKLPGGSGFFAHQDTPAYLNLGDDHISVMIAIDASHEQNGCLQMAGGQWVKGQVLLNDQGVVVPEEEAQMNFVPVLCKPGDIVFFSGYIPHRSDKNHTNQSRRAVFLTFNPKDQGDYHDTYYAAKHARAFGFNEGSAISFQNDFQGVIVD